MNGFPAPYVIPPTSLHTHTIILLHGRGSNGPEFAEELFEGRTSEGLSLRDHLPGWKWVFPTAHTCFSTVFQEEMVEWFDLYSLTDPSLREDLQTQGLRQSVAFIGQLIVEEAKPFNGDARKVVLGGISQGCATAVRVLLSSRQLGAFVGFCSWMPFSSDVQHSVSNKSTPVFLSHARNDEIVSVELGLQLRNILEQQLGMNVTWRGYSDGGHWIREPSGFDDLIDFLRVAVGFA